MTDPVWGLAVRRFAMPTFRIKAEFDMTIKDTDAARSIARQRMIDVVDQAVLEGGTVETGTDTPVEGIDSMLANPLVVSTMVASEMLLRGLSQMPVVELANVQFEHIKD